MKPNFNLMSFKHLLPVNWNIEIMYSPFEDDISITQIKVKRRNNLAIMQMPFYMILRIWKAKVPKYFSG